MLHARPELGAVGHHPAARTYGRTVVDATPYVITPHAPLTPVLMRDFTLRVAGVETLDLKQAQIAYRGSDRGYLARHGR
jgi:hypothetical protein